MKPIDQGNFVWACAHAAPGIFLRTVPHADTCLSAADRFVRIMAFSRPPFITFFIGGIPTIKIGWCQWHCYNWLGSLRLFLRLALHLLSSIRLGLDVSGGASSRDECPHSEAWLRISRLGTV